MAVEITFKPVGSLKIRGNFLLVDEEGNAIAHEEGYVKLCKCGKSNTQPFCDDSHRNI